MAGLADLLPMVQEMERAGMSPEQIADYFRRLQPGSVPVATGTNEIDRELLARQNAESALQGRASTALALLELRRSVDADNAEEARSPYKLIEHLRDLSMLPQGTGNPLQQLIGEGRFIQPSFKSYADDPRYAALEQSALDYSTPSTFTSEVREDPDIARVRQWRAANPNAGMEGWEALAKIPSHASGGSQMLDEPVVGIGLRSRRPRFLAGEAGPERLDFTPELQRRGGSHPATDEGIRMYGHGGTARVGGGLRYGMPRASTAKRDAASSARDRSRRLAADVRSGTSSVGVGQNAMDVAAQLDRSGAQQGRLADMYGKGVDIEARGDAARARRFAANAGNRAAWDAGRAARAAPGYVSDADNIAAGDYAPQVPTATNPQPAPVGANEAALSERQAGAIALGKSLQGNPFATADMVSDLLAGKLPRPGSVRPQFLSMFPALADTLYGLSDAFGVPVRDYAASIDQFRIPGARLYRQ